MKKKNKPRTIRVLYSKSYGNSYNATIQEYKSFRWKTIDECVFWVDCSADIEKEVEKLEKLYRNY
jgi:hypothetical protein